MPRCVAGSFIGTGVAFNVTKVGFKPRHLVLFNSDDPAIGHFIEGMPDGYLATQKAATTAYATTGGVTLLTTGFTIGTHASFNVDGERTWFVAHE